MPPVPTRPALPASDDPRCPTAAQCRRARARPLMLRRRRLRTLCERSSPCPRSPCSLAWACSPTPATVPSTRLSRSSTAMSCMWAFPGWAGSRARRGRGASSGRFWLSACRAPHVNVLTLILLIALQGVGCLLYVGTPYVACALAGQMVLGCAFGMVTPLQNTLVQMHAPIEVLGRVNSVMNAGFNGAGALPLFAAPALRRHLWRAGRARGGEPGGARRSSCLPRRPSSHGRTHRGRGAQTRTGGIASEPVLMPFRFQFFNYSTI